MFFRRAALCLLLLAGTCSITRADENPGDWISDEAAVVVRIRRPKTTMAKVVAFAYSVSPVYAPLYLSSESDLHSFGINPIFFATDLGHDIWWAMFFDDNAEAVSAFIIRTRDGDELTKSLDPDDATQVTLRHGRYVILATAKSAIDRLQVRMDGQGTVWTKSLAPEQRTSFEAGDLSVYINNSQCFAPFIKNSEDEAAARKVIQDSVIKSLIDASGEQLILSPFGREVMEKGASAIADAVGIVVSTTVDHTGIEVEAVLDHDTEHLPASEQPPILSNFQSLRRMPPDRQCYVAGTSPIPSPPGWFINVLNFDSHKGEDAPALAKQQDIQRRLCKLKQGQWSAAFSLPSPFSKELRLDEVAEIENPQAHRLMNNNLAIIQTHFEVFREKQNYELLDGVERYGDRTADVHRITYQKSDKDEVDLNSKNYGPDGLVSRCMYEDNLFINTVGGGQSAMEDALRRIHATESPELPPGLAATRDKLPAEGSFVLMVNASSMIASSVKMELGAANYEGELGEIMKAGIRMAEQQQSYCGVGLALERDRARLKVYIPITQAKVFASTMLGGWAF